MDAFFVNVHLLSHPEDRGKPLAIGGRPQDRGVVASASYEARAFGIRSAMPMSRAIRLCRDLRIVSADWAQIRACSRQVMDQLSTLGPLEKMSVDEAYIDIGDQPAPELLAISIPTLVRQATGLPCSIGLGTSKLVAKVASDFDKPEGCTIVAPGNEASFLAPLPTRALHGIGPRTAEKLAALGIMTCGQLAAISAERLQSHFGPHAASLIRRARGIDNRPIVTERGLPKSISQERTFAEDISDGGKLREKLEALSHPVAASLQRHELVARTVVIKLRWSDFTTLTRQKSVSLPIDEAAAVARLAVELFDENWPPGQSVRLIGVGVAGLEPRTQQQPPLPFALPLT